MRMTSIIEFWISLSSGRLALGGGVGVGERVGDGIICGSVERGLEMSKMDRGGGLEFGLRLLALRRNRSILPQNSSKELYKIVSISY
jgi:hypothetical protein